MKLGVLGSLVWDLIDHPDAETVQRWGGIAYSLAAGAAALPAGWTLRPIVKVGEDLAEEAGVFLDRLPGLERPGGVVTTPHPNNRVHLRYHDRHHRHECLTGGVPAWEWNELDPHLDGLDAVYLNLISGFELSLETMRRVRESFGGPIYADLHSLLLGIGDGGHRVPRPLADRDAWLDSVDVVQVNEAEFGLVAGDDEPWDVAERAVARGLGAFLVTRAAEGARWVSRGEGPLPWTEPHGRMESGSAPLPRPSSPGDPTGCGDVWGVTCFIALMQGARIEEAVRRANAAALRNVAHRGADTLYEHLKEAE